MIKTNYTCYDFLHSAIFLSNISHSTSTLPLSHRLLSFLTSYNNLMNDCNISLFVNLKNHHHRCRGFNHRQEKITMIIIIITATALSPLAVAIQSQRHLHQQKHHQPLVIIIIIISIIIITTSSIATIKNIIVITITAILI